MSTIRLTHRYLMMYWKRSWRGSVGSMELSLARESKRRDRQLKLIYDSP